MRLALGVDGSIFSKKRTKRVQCVIRQLIALCVDMERPTHSESEVQVGELCIHPRSDCGPFQDLKENIVTLLSNMKDVFAGFSKSEFRFIKFHIVLHCPWQIRQYGSLLVMDAGRWEETHAHFAKGVYAQTSKRSANLYSEMAAKLRYMHKVSYQLKAVGVGSFVRRKGGEYRT